MVDLHFHIFSQVKWAEISFKFLKEQIPVFGPIFFCQFPEYGWLEPLKGYTLRKEMAKLTLSESCGKFFGQSWKFNSHWTKELQSLWGLELSKGSGSLTCTHARPL